MVTIRCIFCWLEGKKYQRNFKGSDEFLHFIKLGRINLFRNEVIVCSQLRKNFFPEKEFNKTGLKEKCEMFSIYNIWKMWCWNPPTFKMWIGFDSLNILKWNKDWIRILIPIEWLNFVFLAHRDLHVSRATNKQTNGQTNKKRYS